ncbi:MAG: hypothetical protein GTN78_02160 [Gemmatimonadales bacterium]|nr:hypothetical protein [Gemmatimonadales bacterium]NIN10765.1 hypothetical protein [Gemmatimonadales bacterium]NIQ98995.1 hypothetical protein [Gemmatimonadales bacterium]NIS63814.1 hypothetical protein [Gemmatimonadales bacterium]
MTSPKLLLPLRIPELGPSLGKVITGTGRAPGGLHLDTLRYRLATRLIEDAGEARRLAGREERHAAVAALGRTAWLEAWEEAVSGVAHLLIARIGTRLEAEARAVRMPRSRRRRLELNAAERRALTARLGSTGASLIPALDALEQRAGPALDASALERAKVEAWQDALKTAARRLEAAWLELEDAIDSEAERWRQVAEDVARWRKPWWPVVVVGAVALAVAVWLGLVFGGYLEAPGWFARWWQGVFGR